MHYLVQSASGVSQRAIFEQKSMKEKMHAYFLLCHKGCMACIKWCSQTL